MNSLLLRQLARPGLQQVRNASRGPEAVSTLKTFKLMSYIGVPASVLLVGYNAWRIESDHVNHHQRPEYKAYSHMGLRSKAFPWGDGNHSLFHNRKRNAVPGVGYEED